MATKRISQLAQTATETDLKAGNYFALDGAEGTKRLPAEVVGRKADTTDVYSFQEVNFHTGLKIYNDGSYGNDVSNYYLTTELSVEGGDKLFIEDYYFHATTPTIAFYSGSSWTAISFVANPSTGFFVAPAGAKRCVVQTIASKNTKIYKKEKYAKETELQDADNKIEELIEVVGRNKQVATATNFTSTKIYKNDGTYATFGSWYSTENISCVGFKKVKFKGVEFTNGSVVIPAISFFGASGYISGYSDGTSGTTLVEDEIEIPAGATYMRVVTQTAKTSAPYANLIVSGLVDLTTMLNRVGQLKIACIGDSLTEGDYGSEPSGTINLGEDTYPLYLSKYLGCYVHNFGKSGYTTKNYWENKMQTLSWSTLMPDVVIIMLGTNTGLTDTLATDVNPYTNYSDYANTNTGCYCKIIEYLMEQMQGKGQIVLCLTPWVDPTRRSGKREQADSANIVIPKIADKYGLPVINTRELGLNKSNTNVLQPIDGLHFGKYGYSRLGLFIGSRLKSLLSFDWDK